MNRRRGVTLIELLISMAICVVLLAAVLGAYSTGAQYERRLRVGGDAAHARQLFEDRMRNLFSHAFVSPDINDTTTFFTTVAQSGGTTQTTGTDTVTFTVTGLRIPGNVLESTDDFETQNQNFGPVGGTEEIAISPNPAGQPPNAQTGLFIRQQIPSDGDTSQGGNESLMSPDVVSIQFEFWDGLQWQPSWDTASTDGRRLPAAVRINYQLTGDDSSHVIVVRLPMSDVTAANPITTGGA